MKIAKAPSEFITLPAAPSTSTSASLNSQNLNHTSGVFSLPPENLVQLSRSDTAPVASNQGNEASEFVALDGRTSVFNQQAIRQKVREVSAKQQSLNDRNEQQNETFRQPIRGSTPVSPHSSGGSKSSQNQGVRRPKFNTQHLRELRRKAEKQHDIAQSYSQEYHNLIEGIVYDDVQPLTRDFTASQNNHSIENRPVERQSSNIQQSHFKIEAFLSARSNVEESHTVPTSSPASIAGNQITLPKIETVSTTDDSRQSRSPQPFSPSRRQPVHFNDWGNNVTIDPSLSDQLDYLAFNYVQPRSDYDFSGQASFGSPPFGLSAERHNKDMPLANPQAVKSAMRTELVGESRHHSAHGQDSEPSGYGTQVRPSYKASQLERPPESIQIQSPSQSSGTEDQSPYGQQNDSVRRFHNQSAYTVQSQPQSLFIQSQLEGTNNSGGTNLQPHAIPVDTSQSQNIHDPFLDTDQASSTVAPVIHAYPNTNQLRATSPAFVPSSLNARIGPSYTRTTFNSSVQGSAPFPAVRGTERHHRPRRRSHRPDLTSTNCDQATELFGASSESTTNSQIACRKDTQIPQNIDNDAFNSRNHIHGHTVGPIKTSDLRDPMPYTGFSSNASKKEQLLGNLNKTIDEAKTKGTLSASNRSVLFDPVASGAPAAAIYGSSSTTRTDRISAAANVRDNRLQTKGTFLSVSDPVHLSCLRLLSLLKH